MMFCERLSKKTGRKYTLPTEAQWEYACRAGSNTKYYFGDSEDELADYAWYYKNSDGETHPVGEKKPNTYGLYDMHGNVWEWCHDWYGDYPTGSVTNPLGPSSGSTRVLRGGSWSSVAWNFRSGYRYRYEPGIRYDFLGFRLAAP